MNYDTSFAVNNREISADAQVWFIADIAANHDGDLGRARDLIGLAGDAGADVVKFQHFLAKDIVSDYGFRELGSQIAHQAKWDKPVYKIYEQYQLDRDWNATLAETAAAAGVEFMTTPYDDDAIEGVDPLVNAYKIGSGDITWTGFIETVAKRGKPVLLASGASDAADVERAVAAALAHNSALCLMQCNTNYTGDKENFSYVNLNVLRGYAKRYPGMVLGLSDHTPGHATVLGAVALGARVIEKHFTDDTSRDGPDHGFSMTPSTWREMVERTTELKAAMGDGIKRIEDNEHDSAIVQRRCIRLKRDAAAGETLGEADVECLRPAPEGAMAPWRMAEIKGRRLVRNKVRGEALCDDDLGGKA